jgi:hypothetical protein
MVNGDADCCGAWCVHICLDVRVELAYSVYTILRKGRPVLHASSSLVRFSFHKESAIHSQCFVLIFSLFGALAPTLMTSKDFYSIYYPHGSGIAF